jgi:hypothetical protein
MDQSNFTADDAAARDILQLPPEFVATPGPWRPGDGAQVPASEPEEAPAGEEPSADAAAIPGPPEFDEKHRMRFRGMLYIGALTDHFDLFGHSFIMATPSETDRLQIGLVMQPYQSTMTAEIAYQNALVAAYLIEVDGRKLPQPITTDPKDTALLHRFQWVTTNLKRPVVNKLFERCLELDKQVEDVLAAMGKASG